MLKNENYNKQLLIGLVITLLLLASFTFLMFSEDTRIVEVSEQHESESRLRGCELYAENCSSCHGASGEGMAAPALNNKTFLEEVDDGVLFATIQTGRPNTTMPAWGQAYGGALTAEDIHDIVNFIQSFEEGEAPPTAAGEAGLYDTEIAAQAFQKGNCAGCHVIPGVPNAVGTLGPDLSEVGFLAEERIQSEDYMGNATTAAEFLLESLIEPDAFISPDCASGPCQAGLMLSTAQVLSDIENDAVVGYLESLPDGASAAQVDLGVCD